MVRSKYLSLLLIYSLVVISGFSSLSWEMLWQIKSSLALGISAYGTAITLAVTMGGMSIGAFGASRFFQNRHPTYPTRSYGVFEFVIGFCGLFLGEAFHQIEQLDSWAFNALPGAAKGIHIFAIVATMGIPTICMGATFPVFGFMAKHFKTSLVALYGVNTFGAAAGVLATALLFIPAFGVSGTGYLIAGLNMFLAVAAFCIAPWNAESDRDRSEPADDRSQTLKPTVEVLIVGISGFSVFALEIAWFRSLTAAYHSTTTAFAVMLATVLSGLAIGASTAPMLREKKISLGSIVMLAGLLVLITAPLIERYDVAITYVRQSGIPLVKLFFSVLVVIVEYVFLILPVAMLGSIFPWIINEQSLSRRWGILYGANTLAGIFGSVVTAWVLLPAIGHVHVLWLIGFLIASAGIIISPHRLRLYFSVLIVAALLVAKISESGVGDTRVQGNGNAFDLTTKKVLQYFDGPEATVSAIEDENGNRILIVDGFSTAAQQKNITSVHYMPWMGHLPMLLHPNPVRALVICFGTGQTANAVREENPKTLDIVDINPRIFKLAHNFTANNNVLGDPRTNAIVMDGRAFVRRTQNSYDVITLEPMPPKFAGVNALYSKEFYEHALQKLGPDGVIAQWLPFHLVELRYAASIAKTFQAVFPNADLWIDPESGTGILLGSKSNKADLVSDWPGFSRPGTGRDLSEQQVRSAIRLDRGQLKIYGGYGEIITDDNQLLAYGKMASGRPIAESEMAKESIDIIDKIRSGRISGPVFSRP